MPRSDEPQVDYAKSLADLARSACRDLERGDEVWIVRKAAELGHRFERADPSERHRMLAEEPPSMGDRRWDAFVAAMAEWLAVRFDVPVPPWAHHDDRYLNGGWWVTKMRSLYAWEYAGSPASFQNHGVYIHRESLTNV